MQTPINYYYATLEQYKNFPAAHLGGQIALGQGVNMTDPLEPVLKTARPFERVTSLNVELRSSPLLSDDIKLTNATIMKSVSEKEESRIISEYLSASYMVGNAKQSLEKAKEVRNSYHTIYLLLEARGESRPRADAPPMDTIWKQPPVSEQASSVENAFLQFSRTYGTHFLSKIEYGMRLVIQAKVRKSQIIDQLKFEAAAGAAFESFQAEGGLTSTAKDAVSEMNMEFLFSCSGNMTDKEGNNITVVPTDLESIEDCIDRIHNQEIIIESTPIYYTLDSFWSTLDQKNWNLSWEALHPSRGFEPAKANFGVPAGTILPWQPTPAHTLNLENEDKIVYVAPQGWAICDGTEGTPDLRKRFLRGMINIGELPGGSETHNHGGSTGKGGGSATVAKKAGLVVKTKMVSSKNHTHTISQVNHLPPYYPVIFIMKL